MKKVIIVGVILGLLAAFVVRNLPKTPNVAAFSQWTREDPLFTVPYFDIDGFKRSIEVLRYLEKEYNKTAHKNDRFFPISFLEKIPDVYRAEDKFIKNPSYKTGEDLLSSYVQAAEAYQKEADTFLKTIQQNEGKIPSADYLAFNSTTTKEVMLSDVKKVSQNAAYVLAEITKRKDCLERGVGCKKPLSTLAVPNVATPIQEKIGRILSLSDLLPSASQEELRTLTGPFIVETACFGWGENFTTKSQPFYILTISSNGLRNTPFPARSPWIKYAATNYYRKLSTTGWEKDFITDLPLITQNEDNLYVCRDTTYQNEVLVLDYFWKNLKDKPLFEGIDRGKLSTNQKELFKKAQAFEKNFFAMSAPSWKNMETLGLYYAYAYKVFPERSDFLKRYLFIDRKIAQSPEMTLKGASNFGSLITKEKASPGITTRDYFYSSGILLARNMWTYLYFPFSRSMWRNPQNLEYLAKKEVINIGEGKSYLDYEMVIKKFPPEYVKRMQVEKREYHERESY